MEIFIFLIVLIGLISLIIFLVMASNIGKIQKNVEQIRKRIAPLHKDHEFLADHAFSRGNKQKTIEHLKEYLYEINAYTETNHAHIAPYWKAEEKRIKERIEKLDGTI